MTLRIIEISAPSDSSEKIRKLAEHYNAIDVWHTENKKWFGKRENPRETTRILIDVANQQDLMDALQRTVKDNDDWRIMMIPVEATLPKPVDQKNEEKKEHIENEQKKSDGSFIGKAKSGIKAWFKFLNLKSILQGSVTREELLSDMEAGGKLNFDYIVLVFLSSIVAGVGLIQSDVAIIIGAMVIAPLLGPNLALSFSAALGDKELFTKAVITNIVGVSFTLLVSIIAGFFIPEATITASDELMSRTNVSYASIALALAAGGAAVLSLTTGVSSALVGVMVAVALLPPAVALGLTIGNAQWNLALGTGLLLATNIVCINLAALTVFRLKGIKPRTWYEEKNAKKASRTNLIFWLGLLAVLAILIWLKNSYFEMSTF